MLTLEAGGGSLSASWPRAARADSYLVEAYAPGAEEPLLSLESGRQQLHPLPAARRRAPCASPSRRSSTSTSWRASSPAPGAQPIDVTVTLAGMDARRDRL